MTVHFVKYIFDKIFEYSYIKVNLANKEQFNGHFNGSTLRWFCISCYFSCFRKRMVRLFLYFSGCITWRYVCLQSVSRVSALSPPQLISSHFQPINSTIKKSPGHSGTCQSGIKGVSKNPSHQEHNIDF